MGSIGKKKRQNEQVTFRYSILFVIMTRRVHALMRLVGCCWVGGWVGTHTVMHRWVSRTKLEELSPLYAVQIVIDCSYTKFQNKWNVISKSHSMDARYRSITQGFLMF